jgi:hypothetical protein
MPTRLMAVLPACLIAGLLSIAAQAQPAGAAAIDCNKARDPQRCQARVAAQAACQGKRGAARRQCVEDNMPPPDCSKSPNPARCSAILAAREACKDKVGLAHRQCMRERARPTKP